MRKIIVLAVALGFASGASAQFYASDFESDNGGWTASATWDPVGDWEWGPYSFGSYTGGYNPPPAAHSGDSLWGTVLHGDYTNAGGESFLSQTFDFSGLSAPFEMNWWNWAEVFYTFDTAKLLVNGDLLYERTTSSAPTAWEFEAVDLSPYAGMGAVDIVFELHASTVVERAGWYIDDVTITPEPGSLALLALGAIGLIRRR